MDSVSGNRAEWTMVIVGDQNGEQVHCDKNDGTNDGLWQSRCHPKLMNFCGEIERVSILTGSLNSGLRNVTSCT